MGSTSHGLSATVTALSVVRSTPVIKTEVLRMLTCLITNKPVIVIFWSIVPVLGDTEFTIGVASTSNVNVKGPGCVTHFKKAVRD